MTLLGAAAVKSPAALTQEAGHMYGLISKLTVVPGRRAELTTIFKEGALDMPGCLSYVVAEDATDVNVVWITEAWQSVDTHGASLSLPAVKTTMSRGRPLIANFERIAVTNPVLGVDPPQARSH